MISLSMKDGDAFLGEISEADLQLLIDLLEEEDESDTDYYVTLATVEFLEQRGASAGLIQILREAVGSSEGAEVVWKKS
jgi:hypothetical protein